MRAPLVGWTSGPSRPRRDRTVDRANGPTGRARRSPAGVPGTLFSPDDERTAMTEFATIEDVFAEQLGDLRSAEQQLLKALPKMADAASTDELRQAFSDHLEETRGHAKRLDQIIGDVEFEVPDEHCQGMEGLLKEGDDVVSADGDPAAKDA